MQLTRIRRDFGITTLKIGTMLTVVAGSITAALAITQNTITVQMLHEAIQVSAKGLETENLINNHFHNAILNLQQQIDLLKEVQTLNLMKRLYCDPQFSTYSLIPLMIKKNTTLVHQQLTKYIKGTWSRSFLNYSLVWEN